jgi:phenylpyruvate tautomerase PptA (4-oxalocrotonate tautomerase family)
MNHKMPTFILNTNCKKIDSIAEEIIHKKVRDHIVRVIEKSEEFVLTIVNEGMKMNFGVNDDPCAYCEVKNVGLLDPEQTKQLSLLICNEISEQLNINTKKIYLEFQSSDRHMWGWDSSTFAS